MLIPICYLCQILLSSLISTSCYKWKDGRYYSKLETFARIHIKGTLVAHNTANFQGLYFNWEACQEHISQIFDQIRLGLKLFSLTNFTLKSPKLNVKEENIFKCTNLHNSPLSECYWPCSQKTRQLIGLKRLHFDRRSQGNNAGIMIHRPQCWVF